MEPQYTLAHTKPVSKVANWQRWPAWKVGRPVTGWEGRACSETETQFHTLNPYVLSYAPMILSGSQPSWITGNIGNTRNSDRFQCCPESYIGGAGKQFTG